MKTRFISLVLCLIMIVSLLAGCSQSSVEDAMEDAASQNAGAKTLTMWIITENEKVQVVDKNGEPVERRERAFSSLRMGDRSLFFKDALSALVTVDTDGSIEIEGMTTEWAYGIAPKELPLTPELLSISDWKNK